MTYLKKATCSAICALTLAAGLASAPDRAAADEPFLGEVRLVGFTFCPRGWTEAAGQLLPIAQNQSLYALYGTTFGGDGRTSFALPDMRGRIAIGIGDGPGLTLRQLGQKFGAPNVNLTQVDLAPHSHLVNVTNAEGDQGGPGDKILAAGHGDETIYSTETANRTMAATMITNTGSGQAFSIQDPYLGIRHCVALQGLFPPRS